jgi:DnaK suppressor protein
MNDKDIKLLKEQIRDRIAVLEMQLREHNPVSENIQEQAGDQSASLDITISATVETTVIESARAEKKRLEHNLTWLDSEDAGICEHCGCAIALPRLKAVPETRLCVTCAEGK